MKDVFEWDDATQEIVEKAVESRELDNATENLKSQAEDSLDKNFHQFNFEEILRDRDTVIKSVQQVLGPKLDSFEKWHSKIEDRESQDSFEANKQDNAVDWEDYKNLRDNYDRLRSIHSLTTIWAFVAHANSSDVAKAVDIRQMQADQNKAMEMVNKNFEGVENLVEGIAGEIKRGQKEALREIMDEKDKKVERLQEENEKLREKVSELEESVEGLVDPRSLEPLTENQKEIYDYMKENPMADNSEIADATDTAVNQVPTQVKRIERKGWPIE